MDFFNIYIQAFIPVLALMTALWIISVALRDASIVDPFWSVGFMVATAWYFQQGQGNDHRKVLVLILVMVWGLRLFIHLFLRFYRATGEDHRYRNFRNTYGAHRYWWFSFLQVFLLQGTLLWLISLPLLAAMHLGTDAPVGILDYAAAAVWLMGFIFEAGGDYQLMRFKKDPNNKGKLLTTGFWGLTRHPNYFGDAVVWWGFGLFGLASGAWWAIPAPLLMTFLLLRVSGVAMLERSLRNKPGFGVYKRKTPAFFPGIHRATRKGDGDTK